MTRWVLDSSAVMAFVNDEEGSDVVERAMDEGAIVSSVILQEVVAIFIRKGTSPEACDEAIASLGLEVHDHTTSLAHDAGHMIAITKPHGLSLGDRACLALAKSLGLPTLTSDRPWAEVADKIGVRVELLR